MVPPPFDCGLMSSPTAGPPSLRTLLRCCRIFGCDRFPLVARRSTPRPRPICFASLERCSDWPRAVIGWSLGRFQRARYWSALSSWPVSRCRLSIWPRQPPLCPPPSGSTNPKIPLPVHLKKLTGWYWSLPSTINFQITTAAEILRMDHAVSSDRPGPTLLLGTPVAP